MEWILSNPMFAWMLPAAALPVVFHFFFRFRTKPAVFSTLMFFDDIDPRLSARRRIHEWLVLLLRSLFIALLLAALARPVWMVAGGGRRAVVMLIDNSGSMSGAFRDGVTRLRAATDVARALVGRLHGHDMAGVVLAVEDPTVSLPVELSADRSLIRAALDRVVETEASAEPGGALLRAIAMVDSVAAASPEVHILSDFQETEWGRAGVRMPQPRPGTSVFVHRITAAPPAKGNLAFAGFRMPAGRLLAGRKIPVQARISNPGSGEVAAIMHWTDDGGGKGTAPITVPAGGEKLVPLMLRPDAPGPHWVYAWLQDDGFAADNRAGLGFECAERVPVLLAGAAGDFGLLPLALSPEGAGELSGIRVEFVLPGALPAGIREFKPALVAGQWATLAEQEAVLREFVAGGGNLLLLPSGAPGPPDALPPWAGARMMAVEETKEGAAVVVFQKSSDLLADLRAGDGPLLRGVKAFRFQALEPARDDEAVLGFENGRALLVAHREGAGYVFTSGMGFDPAASTLPLKAAFLALAQRMALASAAAPSSAGIVAGERATQLLEKSREVAVTSLAGSSLEWKGEGAAMPPFPRAGVFALRAGDASVCLGVRASEREGLARFVTGPRVPALGAIEHRTEDLREVDTLVQTMDRERRGLDLYPYLLTAAMLCLMAETWVANRRRSATRSGTGGAGRGVVREAA